MLFINDVYKKMLFKKMLFKKNVIHKCHLKMLLLGTKKYHLINHSKNVIHLMMFKKNVIQKKCYSKKSFKNVIARY